MLKRKSAILLLSVTVLVIAGVACGGGTPTPEDVASPLATDQPVAPPPTPPPAEPTSPPAESGGDYDTVFPLPDDVQNFMKLDEDTINFQTSLSLEEVIEFYRQALTGQGLTEREILTVIDDAAFSMVFDGWSNDKALVIQGVDQGETANVNIRFEDV